VTICFVLLHQSSFWRNSSEASSPLNSTSETKKLGLQEIVLSDVRVFDAPKSESTEEPQAPNWEVRFSEISDQPSWLQSQEEFDELADSLPGEQIRSVLDQLQANQSDTAIILGDALLRRWATHSLEDAVQWVEHLPEGRSARAAFREIVVVWSKQDLTGAVGWVQQLPEGSNKTAAGLALASEAATRKEGVTAINLVADLPQSPERDELLNYSARQWAIVDQNNAVLWIERIQDPMLREEMLVNVAIDWAVQDPFNAAIFASTALTPGLGQNNAVINIVRFMAVSAPDRAAAWVEQFPEGNLRATAMENLMDVWGKDDPDAASEWGKTKL
jgi:hypothetical protein